ncbi:MAG: response regulator transcription factor [Isosphaeraceae bacterium]|nr:response regulator transcription factor [Isosphaeraceae bacterium]
MAREQVAADLTAERIPSILIIDADAERCVGLVEYLIARGLSADSVHDARRGLARAFGRSYDLILLDSALPDRGGLELLRAIRQRSQVPIVVLSSWFTQSDAVAALDAGADDTIAKPFEHEELAARIRAVLRRAHRPAVDGPRVLDVNGVRLVPGAREVSCDGRRVETTSIEFQILELLVASAGRPVSRDEMISVLHRRPATPFDRSLDVHVSHLRKKLGARGALIRTVRGVGYLFRAETDGQACSDTETHREPA